MWWPKQSVRVKFYRAASLPIFISLFLLGEYRWIAFVAVGLVLFGASLETCKRCGGNLLLFGKPERDDTERLVCHCCASGRSGFLG